MSPEEVAQAVALHNDGRSIRYIANLLAIPRARYPMRYKDSGKLVLTQKDLDKEDDE
jgi:hypothetical protein